MQRSSLSLLFLLPTVLVCLTMGTPPTLATPSKEGLRHRIHQLLQQKLKKKQKARAARVKLHSLKTQENEISSQVRETQERLETAKAQLATVSQRLQTTRARLAKTQERLQVVQARLERHNEALGARLVSIYKYGSLTYVELLLDSRSFSDVVKRTYLFRKIVENDIQLLRDIKAEKAEIAMRTNMLKEQERQVRGLHIEASRKQEEIATQAERERQLLFRIRHERAAYEQYVRELERESNAIANMIRRLTETRAGGYVVPWRGGFIRPVSGRLTSFFGSRLHPIFHVRRMHTGVDLTAPSGATIRAAAGGRCIYSGWRGGYGKTVIIDHGGGVATVYGHCSALLVAAGALVKQGQEIARVGSTGLSTGPHLHFEVRRRGIPVNPLTFR